MLSDALREFLRDCAMIARFGPDGAKKARHGFSCLGHFYRKALNGQLMRLAETGKNKSRTLGTLRLFLPTNIKHTGKSSGYYARKKVLTSAGDEPVGSDQKSSDERRYGKRERFTIREELAE